MLKAAIYCRLSDAGPGAGNIPESESIHNQKSLLLRYAVAHDFEVEQMYVDDNYSGTDTTRPAFRQMIRDAGAFEKDFDRIVFGAPLLTSQEDNERVIQAVVREMPLKGDEALVFMGHGTSHFANSIYAALDYQFKDRGYKNVFMGTVEAYPSMDLWYHQRL